MVTIFFGKTNDCANKKQQPYHNSLTINDKSRAESRLSTPGTTTAAKAMEPPHMIEVAPLERSRRPST